ncbi:MAG: GNAT family N-acetyltransferase, partial [Anaerolineae bacterium]
MVVTAPAKGGARRGPRPINLNTDIPQVLKLLEVCFGTSVGLDGQRFYPRSVNPNQQAAFLWRLNPAAGKLTLGFVWEENGRIVGNVTVLTTKVPGRYLVVNVAVHPDQRQRGIAHQLMKSVHQLVHERNGNEIMLQVAKQNTAAVNLYNTLQYTSLGSITSWYASVSRLSQLEPAVDGRRGPHIRELRSSEWRAAYHLDLLALAPDLNWPEPPNADA